MANKRKRKFPIGIGDTLLSEDRMRMIDPRTVLRSFGVREGVTLIDVGCGPGAFLEAASESVGENGTVIAVDIQEPFINMARRLAEEKGLRNIRFIVSKESSIPVESGSADVALIVTSLHEFEGDGTLKEVRRILRKGGKLAVVEWEKMKSPIGPPLAERLSQEEAEKMLSECNFAVEKIFQAGKYHYGIEA
ncbi:MAG: class I SAM-dependent methyltransferase, partial [Candidatus Thermoplasmatota archaeon]|nr:class I SAM-dependent methyltransferase [Candidatus Thermoplasmatota archaeon]